MKSRLSIQDRTKRFAIRVIKACDFLNNQPGVCRTLSTQLLRSGCSIGANAHEAIHASSNADFIHRLSISLREAYETKYWIEVLIESGKVKKERFEPLLNEVIEIGKILNVSIQKLKAK